MSEFKVGDRVWLLSAGWDVATVTNLNPLMIQFDDVKKPIKVRARELQWLRPVMDYPMPKVGDTIKIKEGHIVSAGKEFVVAEVQGGGWVKTTEGSLFHYSFFGEQP